MTITRVCGQVTSKYLGSTTFVGSGAGRYPTATSVVADMINIALGAYYAPVVCVFIRPNRSCEWHCVRLCGARRHAVCQALPQARA